MSLRGGAVRYLDQGWLLETRPNSISIQGNQRVVTFVHVYCLNLLQILVGLA
jgi:hypothetical protein